MSPLRFLLICLVIACNAHFAQAQTYIGKQKHIDQILTNIEQFSKFYMAGDVESLVNCYTDDGKIFPGGRMIMEGAEDLRAYWTIPEGAKTLYHKIKPVEIKVVKDTAYDYGYYEGKSQNTKGEKSSWQGKYLIVWKKVGKDWKIYLDIWNRTPAPQK